MSAIGPALPPHLLAKRKRQQEEVAENESNTTSGAKRASTSDDTDKRRRVMGPAMPPVRLDERPTAPTNEEEASDDSDDDIGPALPATGETAGITALLGSDDYQTADSGHTNPLPSGSLQRDNWMLIPPKQDDLAARLDPSKPRPKGFNTGKSARTGGGADSDNSTWHETVEQKRKRLENEMMGVAEGPSEREGGRFGLSKNVAPRPRGQEREAKARGPSLLEQHQQHKGKEAEDDDPSKRAFDREKDMAGGMRISSSQRKRLLEKASDFESRFSKGSSR